MIDDDGLKIRRCDASHLLIDLQTPLGAQQPDHRGVSPLLALQAS
jgi:hypothetical protein